MSKIIKPFIFVKPVLLLLLIIPGMSFADISTNLINEAKKLYRVQEKYLKHCLANEFKAIYNYHHPHYKKKISFDEFLYFDGKIEFGYRDGLRASVSGGYSIAPMELILRNAGQRKDILGYPSLRKFQWTTNDLVDIKSFTIESISMTSDKNFAKITTRLNGKMTLPPGAVHAIMKIPYSQPYLDFWEKVDGQWVITILQDVSHVSGGRAKFYYIPKSQEVWNKKRFVKFSSSELLKNKL